jgi:cation diffusion facilitator family transporter
MHIKSIDRWSHDHAFLGENHDRNESRTWLVVAITAAMMVAEIGGGVWYGSMALLADGWHMSTHAGAIAITALSYRYARHYSNDRRFSFGTGKIGDLAGFASGIILLLVALSIAFGSVERLINPVSISYGEAIAIVVVGLLVNLICAWLLHDDHDHHHDDHGTHSDNHHHHDSNLFAAYLHVLADAATSVFALIGLALAWKFGWNWADPVVAFAGAVLVGKWAIGLLRQTAVVLIDATSDRSLEASIRSRLEVGGDRLADLHVWQLGPGHYGAIASIVSDNPQPPSTYKRKLFGLRGLSHLTIEVEICDAREGLLAN